MQIDEQPMRRPLLGILATWTVGLLLGLIFPVPASVPLFFSAILLALAFCRPWRSLRGVWLGLALAAVGCAWMAMQARPPASGALHEFMQRPQEYVAIRGRITDDPVREEEERGAVSWRFTLRVEEVNRVGEFEPASGQVDVRLRTHAQDQITPFYGDTWALAGTIQHLPRSQNWRWAYLPPYRMQVFPESAQRLSSGDGHWLKHISYRGRHAAAHTLGLGLEDDPELVGIMRALLLGFRHELPDEHHRLFAWTGTLHIFSISGLHVSIWAALLFVVIRSMGVSKRYWVLWVAPLLIVYVIATGLRPSAMRACVMTLAFSGAYLCNRKPDAPSAWALAALLILVLSPTQLVAPGFLFSFVIVAGLIRLYPLLSGPARSWWTLDPYVPSPILSRPRRLAMSVMGLGAASIAAWLSAAPLGAYYFNLFTPIGLLGNLLVIPAAFVLVFGGILSLLAGTLSTVGAEVFNHANRAVLTGLMQCIDWLASVPGGHQFVRRPPLYAIFIWYGFLFGGALFPRRARRTFYAGLVVLSLALLVAAGFDRSTSIHVLPVGDGHAVLIANGPETILYDAGPAYRSDSLIRTLRRHGVNRIDTLILSQASAGHAGGAVAVLDEFPVRELWYSPFPSRSPAYDQALQRAAALGIEQRVIAAGADGEWGRGLAWEVLHPAEVTAWGRAADAALVMRLSRGTVAVLLTGGGGAAVERAILAYPQDPTALIWIMGSGAPEGAAGESWLAAMEPSEVVIDVSPFNRQGLPARDVLERLGRQAGLRTWRTDADGEITIRIDSRIRRMRQVDRWEIGSTRQK